jgi:hypothetical protein
MDPKRKTVRKDVFSLQFLLMFFVLVSMAVLLPLAIQGMNDNASTALLMTPLIFPAVMLPGGGNLFKSKISLVVLAIVVVTSSILLMGNAGGWFGQGPVEPYMWHKSGHIRIEGKEVSVVYLNIQNKGSGSMKLRLDPVMSPGETSLVLTSQQYNETKKQWVDYPIGRLLSERSKSMFPLEVRPGGSLLVEMIFIAPDQNADAASRLFENQPGRYSIAISDPVKLRTYHHEIDVPPFPPAPA